LSGELRHRHKLRISGRPRGFYAPTHVDEPTVTQAPKLKPERKQAKTELLKVRLTPEERAELEAMAGTSMLSRLVRGLLREARND
jgi:hypothetical protein